jgi:hypothetical protein
VFGRGARSAFKPRVWRPPVVVMVGGLARFGWPVLGRRLGAVDAL